MVNFPTKASASISGIYTPVDGIYSLRDQRRLLSGTDWPPSAVSGGGGGGGGGATGNIYSNTNSYTFNGSQTSPTNLSSGISAGTVADFDLQFDIYTTGTNGNNEWFLSNNGYNDTNGFLLGYYDNVYHGIAVAGNGIGGYGFDPASNLPTSQTVTVRVECRFSSAGTISVYHNNSLQGTSSGYTTSGINWDYLYLGMGRSSSVGGGFSSPFAGTISNIYISSA